MTQLSRCDVCDRLEREEIAVKEARRMGVPVVSVVDTNCDPM
jgi:ribosomal protein S2